MLIKHKMLAGKPEGIKWTDIPRSIWRIILKTILKEEGSCGSRWASLACQWTYMSRLHIQTLLFLQVFRLNVCISNPYSTCNMYCSPHLPSFHSNNILLKSTNYEAPYLGHAIFSALLIVTLPASDIFPRHLNLCSSLRRETKFHIYTKNM
jgi:hypothetical protein